MTDDDHRELADVLHRIKGKVALSSYESPLMSELYAGWQCIEAPPRKVHSVKQDRTELLWINYTPDDTHDTDAPLFDLLPETED